MPHGRQLGPPATPSTPETVFGWVLAGSVKVEQPSATKQTTTCCTMLLGDDLLRKFWDVEECVCHEPTLSIEEKTVHKHFDTAHTKDENGRYIVPLPRKENATPLEDSRALVKNQ